MRITGAARFGPDEDDCADAVLMRLDDEIRIPFAVPAEGGADGVDAVAL